MKSNPLQFALRETQAAGRSRYTWIALGLVIALLTVSGPYDTFESLGLGPRFAYWASMVLACCFVGRVATRFFLESLRDAIPQRWPRAVIMNEVGQRVTSQAGSETALPSFAVPSALED